MPKMKTHSSAKKRFTLTGKGKIKCRHANTSHLMRNKSKSSKLKNRHAAYVDVTLEPRVRRMLCI